MQRARARRVHGARHGLARGAGQVPPPGSPAPCRAPPPARPGDGTRPRRRPALETPPDILLETLYQSLAFFYVNPILSALGLSFIPDVPARPARLRVDRWACLSSRSCRRAPPARVLIAALGPAGLRRRHRAGAPRRPGRLQLCQRVVRARSSPVSTRAVFRPERRAQTRACTRRSLMLLPLMVADRKGQGVRRKLPLYVATQARRRARPPPRAARARAGG
jgi:hypothetical protein